MSFKLPFRFVVVLFSVLVMWSSCLLLCLGRQTYGVVVFCFFISLFSTTAAFLSR